MPGLPGVPAFPQEVERSSWIKCHFQGPLVLSELPLLLLEQYNKLCPAKAELCCSITLCVKGLHLFLPSKYIALPRWGFTQTALRKLAETAVGIGSYLLDLIYSVHRDFQMPAQASICSKGFLPRDWRLLCTPVRGWKCRGSYLDNDVYPSSLAIRWDNFSVCSTRFASFSVGWILNCSQS